MKAGTKIKVARTYMGFRTRSYETFTVEKFRHCLGIFESDDHRKAGRFTPLCTLYEAGPESEIKYISNFGEYTANMVQSWIDCSN
jgi:hypothetical protein